MDILNVLLTAALSLVALFLVTKLEGNKEVSQMTLFDYIIGISIGSIAAELATELENPVRPLTALLFYGVAAWGIAVLTNKSIRVRAFVTGKPLILMDNGTIYRENLKKACLDLSEFLMQCRLQGYFDLKEIQTVVFEHNGAVSILPYAAHRPATPQDLKVQVKNGALLLPVVLDGKILRENLRELGKEEAWLLRTLERGGYGPAEHIFLALSDRGNLLEVYPVTPNPGT